MRPLWGLVVMCTLLLSVAVGAQMTDEYQNWMKSNATLVTDLNKNLTAKSGDAAAMDAKTLEENMAKVLIYWQTRDVNDGVRFSLDTKYGFAQVALLASQGKFDEASAALKMTQANCAGCHMAHREKAADGSFKIKLK
jgi:mono/diheme cytochrome c family protein